MSDCEHRVEPFDMVEAFVETARGAIVPDIESPDVLLYEPTGTTDILWETQKTVGHGCPDCGEVTLAKEITIAGRPYVAVIE